MRRQRWTLALLCCVLLFTALQAQAATGETLVYGWGENAAGELGDGTTESATVPVLVSPIGEEVTAVAGGDDNSLALTAGGDVYEWGNSRHVPALVEGLSGIDAIASSDGTERDSFAIRADDEDTVAGWGENRDGQLGDGTATGSATPVEVSGLSGVTQVATGGNHTLALLGDGTVMAWGANGQGQLGNGTTEASDVPELVPRLTDVAAVAAGPNTSYALLDDGEIRDWGSYEYGALGFGEGCPEECDGYVTHQQTAHGITEAIAIAAGDHFAMALLRDGTVESWGENEYGQQGDGYAHTAPRYNPGPVEGLDAAAIAASADHAYALLGDGEVAAWGKGNEGETGDEGSSEIEDRPRRVVCGRGDLEGVAAVSAGRWFGLAIGEPIGRSCLEPWLTGVTPARGPVQAGEEVSITGHHLEGASQVLFGDVPAKITMTSEKYGVNAIVPRGVAGTVEVTVTTAAGTTEATPLAQFTYEEGPEFGRCVAEHEDHSEQDPSANRTCTEAGWSGANYEWSAAFGGIAPLKDAGTSLSAGQLKLASTGGATITCAAARGAGEYTGNESLSFATLALTGCSEGAAGACQSAGAAAGEVRTGPIAGELGLTQRAASEAKDKAGIELGASEEALASFSCGGVSLSLRGSVIAEAKANKMESGESLKAKAAKGRQKISSFAGGPEAALELKVGASASYERAGLTATLALDNAEALEIDTVF